MVDDAVIVAGGEADPYVPAGGRRQPLVTIPGDVGNKDAPAGEIGRFREIVVDLTG
jgi:hypothetical protein